MAEEAARKRVSYYCGPVARSAHESLARVKLAWGPLGTAKTSWLCWRVYFKAKRAAYQGYSLRAILVRDTYRNLADSTLQTFIGWFPEASAGIPGIGVKSQSMPVDYKLYVGGRFHDVLFRHGQTEQDASMFLSTEYDFIGLEEVAPAYIPGLKKISPGIAEGVFDMALGRLTREKQRAMAIDPELAITCNSPPLTQWASKRIIDKPPDYLHKVNWESFFFPISDNQVNLRDDYYSSLEMAWEGKRGLIQRFIKGQRLPVFVGIPRYNLDQLDRIRERCVEPNFRGFLKPTADNVLQVRLEANPEGYVKIWQPPQLGHKYSIGADVAEGVEGGNFSSAHVLDEISLDIVAAWHGHIEPEMYGEELAVLGYLYNRAKLGVESNNHGLTVLTRLRQLNYPRIVYQRNIEVRGQARDRMGFQTNTRTKPMITNAIGAHLDVEKGTPDPAIVDTELISELQTYGIMENGTTAPQEGCFGDRVISYGIGLLMTKVSGLDAIYPP